MLKKSTTKQLPGHLTNAALAAAGVIGERLAAKGLRKAAEKFKPDLLQKKAYKIGAPALLTAAGIAAMLLAKGKQASKIQSVGLGVAAGAMYRVVNEFAGGTLSGVPAYMTAAERLAAPPPTNYLLTEDLPVRDMDYDEVPLLPAQENRYKV